MLKLNNTADGVHPHYRGLDSSTGSITFKASEMLEKGVEIDVSSVPYFKKEIKRNYFLEGKIKNVKKRR